MAKTAKEREEKLAKIGPEYLEAYKYLKQHAGFDLDAFLDEMESPDWPDEPLGPTNLCLSMREVQSLIDPPGLLAVFSKERIGRQRQKEIRMHLKSCLACVQNLELYKKTIMKI